MLSRQTPCYHHARTVGYALQGARAGPGPNSAQDVVRELFAGVDLPKLVQRMLVVMHEVMFLSTIKVIQGRLLCRLLCFCWWLRPKAFPRAVPMLKKVFMVAFGKTRDGSFLPFLRVVSLTPQPSQL